MYSFKVGDRVRILDNGVPWHLPHYIPVGSVVKIAEANRNDSVSIKNSESEGSRGWIEQVVPLQSIQHAETTDPEDGHTTFEDHLDKVFEEAKQLLLRKHHDYGPHNIGNSPGGPLNGLRVRIWDKVARINNLTERADAPKNESLRDSYVDLVNYGIIALVVMDGNWPDE
jgi:hypothetical protein